MRIILRVRPLEFIFNKNWYSKTRFITPVFYENEKLRIIDIGCLSVGYAKKV